MNGDLAVSKASDRPEWLGEGLRLPDFVIAGVNKCGTTSVFEWLRLHPQVCGSTIKETCFLNDKPKARINLQKHGLEGYGRLFKPQPGENLLMEATPEYFWQHQPMEVLSRLASRPRLLFLLREPAARLYSRFKWLKYSMGAFDSRVGLADWLHRKGGIRCRERGHYVRFLRRWRDAVGEERMRLMLFEELIRDPKGQLQELSRWLALDESFWTDFSFIPRNPSVDPRSRSLHELALRSRNWLPASMINRGLPIYFRFNSRAAPAMTAQEAAILDELREEYAGSNRALAAEFGLELPF